MLREELEVKIYGDEYFDYFFYAACILVVKVFYNIFLKFKLIYNV